MSSRFPDKVKVHVIGRTHEGREIRVVRIGKRWKNRSSTVLILFCIALFVTGKEGRDRADPSQPYSLKEVRQRHAQLGLFLSLFSHNLNLLCQVFTRESGSAPQLSRTSWTSWSPIRSKEASSTCSTSSYFLSQTRTGRYFVVDISDTLF